MSSGILALSQVKLSGMCASEHPSSQT